jgi:hypothetical protein
MNKERHRLITIILGVSGTKKYIHQFWVECKECHYYMLRNGNCRACDNFIDVRYLDKLEFLNKMMRL